MSDAMAALGWFRADRRRRGAVRRWRHVDGWVLAPSWPSDTWAMFDEHGVFVRTFAAIGDAVRFVERHELDEATAAAG